MELVESAEVQLVEAAEVELTEPASFLLLAALVLSLLVIHFLTLS